MNLKSKNESTGSCFGFASRLRRHNASLANHKNFGRSEFLRVLASCHQNLGIEGRADSSEPEYDESGDVVREADTKIDWQDLSCMKCQETAEDTTLLLVHIVEKHGKPFEKKGFRKFRVVTSEIQKQLDWALEAQASCSYVKKKFENSNDLLICPVDSPLCQFLVMRQLRVYFQQVPPNVDGIKLKIEIAGMSYAIIFDFGRVERVRRRLRQNYVMKAQKRKLQELELHCDRVWIPDNDLILKSVRTAEENEALAKALKLSSKCSQEDFLRKANEMKRRREEINNVYNVNVKSDGQPMSAEEKKLISSLSSNFMKPLSEKRKTTYKNPSEVLKKKQQEEQKPKTSKAAKNQKAP